MKKAKMTICVLTKETRALLPRPRENDENGGRHAGKGVIYQRHGFPFPECLVSKNQTFFADLLLQPPLTAPRENRQRLLLSGPLRLRVQSRSRMRLRIAASIAFLFRACSKGVLETIAPLSRG